MKPQRSIFKKTVKSFNTKNLQNWNFLNSTLNAEIKSVTTTTPISSQISEPQFPTKSVNSMNTALNKSPSLPVPNFGTIFAEISDPPSQDFQNGKHDENFFVFDFINISETQNYLKKTFDWMTHIHNNYDNSMIEKIMHDINALLIIKWIFEEFYFKNEIDVSKHLQLMKKNLKKNLKN